MAAAVLVGVLGLMGCALGPPPFYAHSIAGDIASGLRIPEEGYDILRAKQRPGFDHPTCLSPTIQYSGKIAPYWDCIQIGNEYTQCRPSLSGDCVSLEGAAYLLREPERLERILDSVAHPCKYLPSPEAIRENSNIKPAFADLLGRLWFKAKCDTHPDEYPGEVTLQLFEGDKHVKTFTKPARATIRGEG
ncbi:MAG: hypothetical protein H7841_02980 [Magnetospirillum sp. WYHS-4]